MNRKDYLRLLAMAFRDLHSCEAVHSSTVPVKEVFQGQTVWEGEVEVFALYGHPKAHVGYAWAAQKDQDSDVTAVLELPPVKDAQSAVQAAVMAQIKKIKGSSH